MPISRLDTDISAREIAEGLVCAIKLAILAKRLGLLDWFQTLVELREELEDLMDGRT